MAMIDDSELNFLAFSFTKKTNNAKNNMQKNNKISQKN